MKQRILPGLVLLLALLRCLPVPAAAEMLDKDANPPVIAADGSFDSTYQTRMDFSVSGGELTDAQWTRRPLYVSYSVNGTCGQGETVSLSVTGTKSPLLENNNSAQLVFDQLTMKLTLLDTDGQPVGEETRYASGTVQDAVLSHQLDCTVPAGVKTVAITGVFVCRWAGASVVEESVSVTLNLTVQEAETAPLPAGSETEPAAPPEAEPTPPSEPEAMPPSEPESPSAPEPPAETAASPASAEAGPASAETESLPSDEKPWQHAGPLATAAISVLAALAAVLGGAAGGAAAAPAAGAGSAVGNRRQTWEDEVRNEAKTVTDDFGALWGSYGQDAYGKMCDSVQKILNRRPEELIALSKRVPEGSQAVRTAAQTTLRQIADETETLRGLGGAVSDAFTLGGIMNDTLDQMTDRNREDGSLLAGDGVAKAAGKAYISNKLVAKVFRSNPLLVFTDVLMTVGAAGTQGGSTFAPSSLVKGIINAGVDLTCGGITGLSPGKASDEVAERAKAGFYGGYLGNVASASAQAGELAEDTTLGEAADILTDFDYYKSMRRSADQMWSDEKGKMGYTGKVASGIMKGVITTGELMATGTKAASEMAGTVYESAMLKLRKFFA
ncbi:MAG: hypothetical protein VB086_00820 [Clostridiaceae bacterium]|nr:hypothetical protein [Clostridiaceae bacterium]